MAKQDFAATAAYFEIRAQRTQNERRRQQFECAAKLYREKAERRDARKAGDIDPGNVAVVPNRRRRLIELFQAYEKVSP